jgi:hypothetical protein
MLLEYSLALFATDVSPWSNHSTVHVLRCLNNPTPAIEYLVGQQLAVYIFVFRRRRETRRDARRGYGLRLRVGTDDSSDSETLETESQPTSSTHTFSSIRVVVTVLFAVIIILLCCTIFVFPQHQQFAISLLFTPFGCLGRYRLQV